MRANPYFPELINYNFINSLLTFSNLILVNIQCIRFIFTKFRGIWIERRVSPKMNFKKYVVKCDSVEDFEVSMADATTFGHGLGNAL